METKILALYLPQFHRTPENDAWWGDGFTEWTTVREAVPLYAGHKQPRVPLGDNYYNLLDKTTMEWQANLMHQYGIGGMCFYHYYFKDGKKILEKPAENLLKWKDINMPFCFSWANETWAKSWSKLQDKNVWSNLKENIKPRENDDGILLLQDYGDEKQWILHFDYLVPFFQDSRYIKVNGKPVFIIYKPQQISCLTKMVECWRSLAENYGLPGLHLVSVNCKLDCMDAVLYQEPQYTGMMHLTKKYKGVDKGIQNILSYQEIINESVKRNIHCNEYLCTFPGYDDTPRRGKSGTVYEGSTPEAFKDALKRILCISEANKSPFVFINAWNEWGETMYLEPDVVNKYAYLEAIRDAIKEYKMIDYSKIKNASKNNEESALLYEQKIQQYRSYWITLDKWLTVKESGRKAIDFLELKGYKNIAIYGLGMLGNHLMLEFNSSSMKLVYGIDGKGSSIHLDFPVYTLDDELPEADAVVVSVVHEFDSIYQELKNKVHCDIYSLSELLEDHY